MGSILLFWFICRFIPNLQYVLHWIPLYWLPPRLEYAKEEVTNPKLTVCSTVRIIGGRYPRLPVRTSEPVPKEKIKEVINQLKGLTVKAPIRRGDVILRNVAGIGADIIVEMDVEETS
jgi:CxxC motif-containing protein